MRFDYVLVGAGLQTALAVVALAAKAPGRRVAVVDQNPIPLGNHTWCFHENDLPDGTHAWAAPLVARTFPRYRVRFPRYERVVDHRYAMMTVASVAPHFEAALDRLDAHCMFGRRAVDLRRDAVTLDDGTTLEASLVIDARGPEHFDGHAIGYQKFVGYELNLAAPYADCPTLMDATVTQHDGFRFLYCLPLSPTRVLLEDTYYSTSSALDVNTVGARILAHAHALGLQVDGISRTEQGVLPLANQVIPAIDDLHGPLRAGYRGGWFHPVTGYSFPLAVRFAQHLAETSVDEARGHRLQTLLTTERRQARFMVLLNRLLFHAMPDASRRNVLERFYRLPAPLIARFYAARLTHWDRARILCGRPPVGFSLRSALRHSALRLTP